MSAGTDLIETIGDPKTWFNITNEKNRIKQALYNAF